MDSVRILEDSIKITGSYDKEADVLYISLGEPCAAVAVDISDGVIARYNEESQSIVGITVMGLQQTGTEGIKSQVARRTSSRWVGGDRGNQSSQRRKCFPLKKLPLNMQWGWQRLNGWR
jgi:uncharacterized protein YuzE